MVGSVTSSLNRLAAKTAMSAAASKVASTPSKSSSVVNVSALAKLFRAQVPNKSLDEAIALDATNRSTLKVPFNLALTQPIANLALASNAAKLEKLNQLVDLGVINSVTTSSDAPVIKVNYAQMQALNKLLPKLSPANSFALTTDRISAAQANSFTPDLMRKLAAPVTIADDPLKISQSDVWSKLNEFANTKTLGTVQLTSKTSSELKLTYSQLMAGSSIFDKIKTNYQVTVRDVSAGNVNAVAANGNVKKVNVRDSIDSVMFLGSNIQKVADQGKLGAISTTAAPIDISNSLAYFRSHLGVIGALADADKLKSLQITDLTSGKLSLTSVEIARNSKALGIYLNDAGTIVLDNSGPVSAVQAKQIGSLLKVHPNATLAHSLEVSDSAAAILAAADDLFAAGAPTIGKITITGDVNAAQAVAIEAVPDGKILNVVNAFRVTDTASNVLNIDLTPTDHSALNAKINGIRATSALDINALSSVYSSDGSGTLTINAGKGNVLDKLLSGLEISGSSTDISDQIAYLQKLASDGKLRSINPVASSSITASDITTIQTQLRDADLSEYPMSLTIADTIDNLVPSTTADQTAVLARLQTVSKAGLLKSVSASTVSGGTTQATLSIDQSAAFSSALDSVGLGPSLQPMTISATGSDFGTPLTPLGTTPPPYFFPKLGTVSALAGKGQIAQFTVDATDIADLVQREDLTTQLRNLGLINA